MRTPVDFVDRSNKKAQEEKAYCAVHLTSRPSKDHYGNWYTQCWTGHEVNEKCQIMIVKPDGTEVEA